MESAWIKAPNATATRPNAAGYLRGEDGVSVLYVADIDAVLAIYIAQVERASVSVGIRRRGESSERIYVGPISLRADEQAQLGQCLKEFLR